MTCSRYPLDTLRHFLRDRRGSIATVSAAALPMCLCLYMGVLDLTRAQSARSVLQDSLDRATLFAARSDAVSSADVQTIGAKALAANLVNMNGGTLTSATFVPQTADSSILGSASADVATTILGLFGKNKITVGASSKVVRASKNIETALILDVSGSMAGSRLTDLKSAAADLVDIIVQTNQTPFYSKVGIVSYATGVNVGGYADKVRGTIKSGTCSSPGCQYYQFTNMYGYSRTFGVSTCASERTGDDAYTDKAPSSAPLGRNYASPNNPCSTSVIRPLSSDKTVLKQAISGLVASGSSGGQIGVAWGWYLLSPNFAYLWPGESAAASYTKEKLVKAAVLMTDGEYNSTYCNGVISQDSTTGSGDYNDHINCKTPNGNSYAQAKALCKAMKAAGIIVYAVGLDVIDTAAARNLVESCATDSAHVYYPSEGASLRNAFQAIGHSISDLRIAK